VLEHRRAVAIKMLIVNDAVAALAKHLFKSALAIL
jgi:hypothetical protein